MRVFHGSYAKIDKIDLSKCEIGKDFGQGFYVTKIREQAEFWAERRGLSNKTAGIVTELADASTELYKKSWQEIYKMLKIELNNK